MYMVANGNTPHATATYYFNGMKPPLYVKSGTAEVTVNGEVAVNNTLIAYMKDLPFAAVVVYPSVTPDVGSGYGKAEDLMKTIVNNFWQYIMPKPKEDQ
jgi:cell division protein FtsI/penicillin-binding protein 2